MFVTKADPAPDKIARMDGGVVFGSEAAQPFENRWTRFHVFSIGICSGGKFENTVAL